MRVYYNPETGGVLHTLSAEFYPDIPGEWVEAVDRDLGDLGDWYVEAGQLVRGGLAGAKARAISDINAGADAVRRRYVTTITGQDMLYLRKEAEARAYVADPAQDPADYPLIIAEVGITASSAWEVAQVYLNMAALWVVAAAQLETARLGAIAAIEAAESTEDLDAIVAAACAAISGAAE